MITISLCMIVKNEAAVLRRCLTSLGTLADELIIVDTGSTDETKTIAAEFGAKVYDFKWIDDFSAARNFAYAQATCDTILWLDADDILLPEDLSKALALKASLPHDIDCVLMKYNVGFDEQGHVTFSYFRTRLARRTAQPRWYEPVHEYLAVNGKRMESDIAITHAKPHNRHGAPSDRNLRIYQRRLQNGETLSPRGLYYFARELRDHGQYAEAAAKFEQFLDDGQGWVEDNITACGELARCRFALGQDGKALAALHRSFCYDTPRAEIVCQLGHHFLAKKKYAQAAYWFESIFNLPPHQGWGFRQQDCWDYLPCIELAVCYDALGDREKAIAYNEKAAQFKPNSAAVQHNRRYFATSAPK